MMATSDSLIKNMETRDSEDEITSAPRSPNGEQSLEASTPKEEIKVRVLFKDIEFSVRKIKVTSQYAKEVRFLLKNQTGDPIPRDKKIDSPSTENTVEEYFDNVTASSVDMIFIPSDKVEMVSVKDFEVEATNDDNVENQPSTSIQASDVSVQSTSTSTSDIPGQEIYVNVLLDDKEIAFRVGKITVDSQNISKVIFAILTPKEKEEIGETVYTEFSNETTSELKIRLSPSDKTRTSMNPKLKGIKACIEIDLADRTHDSQDLQRDRVDTIEDR